MPKQTFVIDIDAPAEDVFDVMHDYERRLAWDTLLRKAVLLDAAQAGVGVRSLCVGRLWTGGFGVETTYISFRRPHLAAVQLSAPSRLFARFAASLRHLDLEEGRSRTVYTLSSSCRVPAADRLVRGALAVETRRRLRALKAYVEGRPD
jgi:hypothetical protein